MSATFRYVFFEINMCFVRSQNKHVFEHRYFRNQVYHGISGIAYNITSHTCGSFAVIDNGSYFSVVFPDYPDNTLQCDDDATFKVQCHFDNGEDLPDDTYPCCSLDVAVNRDYRSCAYLDGENCTISQTVSECTDGSFFDVTAGSLYVYGETVQREIQGKHCTSQSLTCSVFIHYRQSVRYVHACVFLFAGFSNAISRADR